MRKRTKAGRTTHISLIACLVISQSEWCMFAQTTGRDVGVAVAESRYDATGKKERSEETPSTGVPSADREGSRFRSAVMAAVANASARPAFAVRKVQAAPTP